MRAVGSARVTPAEDGGALRERPAARGTGVVLILVALTALGAALRLSVAGQSLFADELSTYWILDTNGFGGGLDRPHRR